MKELTLLQYTRSAFLLEFVKTRLYTTCPDPDEHYGNSG